MSSHVSESPPAAPTADRQIAGRMPALDGLRAVAVYLVVAFHAGLDRFGGGFIGVDLFFVLSGFLITRLLLLEVDTTGRVDLVRFYARRIRRLLPAAWLAITVTCVLFVAVATPFERRVVVRDARASMFYVANWGFIDRGQDYFAESLSSSPFLHLWSLAVEEQFYVIWPAVVLGVVALRRRSEIAAIAFVASSTVAGALHALTTADDNLIRAYYGTDTRAYQLLAGATLALVVVGRRGIGRRPVPAQASGPLLAISLVSVVAVAMATDLDPVRRGMLATAAAVLAIASVNGGAGAPAWPQRMLAVRAVRRLGDLSYATYLWHWPIVIVIERLVVMGPGATFVVVACASTAIAHVSMDLIERPVRRRSERADRRENTWTIGLAAMGTLVLGIAVLPAILRSDVAPLRAADRLGFADGSSELRTAPVAPTSPTGISDRVEAPPVSSAPWPTQPAADDHVGAAADDRVADPVEVDPDPAVIPTTAPQSSVARPPLPVIPPTVPIRAEPAEPLPVPDGIEDVEEVEVDTAFEEGAGCVNRVPESNDDCTVVRGDGNRLLLIGDSHATKLNIAFAEHAAATGQTLATISMNGCPWQDGLLYEVALPVEAAKQFCRDQNDATYDSFVAGYDPDVVIAVSHDLTTEAYGVVPRPERGVPAELTGLGLIERSTRDSIDALAAPGRRIVLVEPLPNSPFQPLSCLSVATVVDDCAFRVAEWPHAETPLFRQFAGERDDVMTVDMSTLACPHFPVCRPIVDGTLVRVDLDHLFVGYTLEIAADLMSLVGI